MASRIYTMEDVLTRLNITYSGSGNMDCPFCQKRKKLHVNFDKDVWRCACCDLHGNALHFYARYAMNYDLSPSSSAEDKAMVAKELRVFMEGRSDATFEAKPIQQKKPHTTVYVASDDMLNAAYEAMSKIPALQLLPEHRDNLLKRGLSEEAITRNGYRSVPTNMATDPYYDKLYKAEGGESRRTATMGWITAKQIRFGMMIAHSIIAQGIGVQGVPGFFLFGNQWCYWCNPGILIPTRNIKGQIVIWQVRRDKLQRKDDPRYVTVSCQSLPGHVTEAVSRCHFPLANEPLCDASSYVKIPFCLTEGPLKADIAVHLYGSPVAFAAIPGIKTTKDFLNCVDQFLAEHTDTIFNCLDMDRLTNPNVRDGSNKLKDQLMERNIHFEDMYWGVQYASSKLAALTLLAKIRKVPVEKTGSNVFDCLQDVVIALENAGVSTCSYITRTGKKVTSYWDPASKGIDDYLLNSK